MNDAEIIKTIGGPAEVARLLGYGTNGGTQRVFNWLKRGIPDSVKLRHQKLLMKEANKKKATSPAIKAKSATESVVA